MKWRLKTKTDDVSPANNTTEANLKRKPGAWDEDYDYDDPDQQRMVQIRPGVFKEYMSDGIYELKIAHWAKRKETGENPNNYQDDSEENYYSENYSK